MGEDNKIVKKVSGIESANKDEILMKKMLLNEIKNKLRDKIDKNDPSFIKTIKYMLHDDSTKDEH